MAIDIRDNTNRFLADAPTSLSTTEDDEVGRLPADEVIERINDILGYDIFEAALMIEGYAELGPEMLSISESTLPAQTEMLPPE